VQYGPDGQVNTVLYHVLPSLLLSGYQQQQRSLGAQAAQIQIQNQRLATQQQQITDLQSRLAQLEALLVGARPGGSR
jgi:ABC-type uncharacterized transport system permease subunit